MRLWSLHPRYLDAKGLCALWREGLLAQKVLAGRTRGYRHHPQLARFREHAQPSAAIATYLDYVRREANNRGYRFRARIGRVRLQRRLRVSHGQLRFELVHLRKKLWHRDRARYRALARVQRPVPHPLFVAQPGPVASWEVR